MSLSRRTLLTTGAPLLVLGLAPTAHAQGAPIDPRMADRALGPDTAKVVVQEWFSLTCTHCARFSQTVFPEVKAKLIDTGRIRYVYRDYPLDQVALAAAMVARGLPPERYEAFVQSLFASQDRWAFSQSNDPQAVLSQMAALAGMSHETFERTVNDQDLKKAILAEQDHGEKTYKIDSTPSFVFAETLFTGEMDYDTFVQQVTKAGA